MFQITRNIWQGRFASRQRLSELQRTGITHILNVGEAPNQLSESDGPFAMVQSYPFEDLVRIPTEQAIECLNILHKMVTVADSNVYIHCIAGWNRSPTILWLYLIASGIEPHKAKTRIESASYDAVPAHSKLVDKELTDAVLQYGHRYFLPHPRPNAILPITPD